VDREELRRLAEVVARAEGGNIGVADARLAGELLLDPVDGDVGRAAVHPGQEAEREHVLRALRVLGHDPLDALGGAHGERGHRHAEHLVVLERAVLQRVGLVARLAQVVLLERVLVGDDRAALLERAEVGLERRRVHRDEHVRVVSRREDVAGGEMDLEGGDAVESAGGSADLGGEIRKRGEVVADHRRGVREAAADQLHPVAGVAREADNYSFSLLDSLGHSERDRRAYLGYVPL
jgi:hypothetical protein